MSVYRYRGFGGLRGLGRLRARRTPRRLARSRANGTCAYVRLWVGLVVRYGCEVRLCDPCVRVSRVPCVPDSPNWSAGTATTIAEITACERRQRKAKVSGWLTTWPESDGHGARDCLLDLPRGGETIASSTIFLVVSPPRGRSPRARTRARARARPLFIAT